jgi:hypothetical protein
MNTRRRLGGPPSISGVRVAGSIFTNLYVVATPDTSNRTDVLFRGATQP